MRIDLNNQPEPDIFCNKKRYIQWFSFFLVMAFAAVALGFYAIYFNRTTIDFEDWALGLLVVSSFGITRFGNRLQKYKPLYPPHREKLASLRIQYPVIDRYCTEVEALKRRLIRAEYDACVEYAEDHEATQGAKEQTKQVIYGPVEQPKKKK